MNRLHSKRVASSPSRGFSGRENTFSLKSSSTPRVPASSGGGKSFRIPRTLLLIIHGPYPFMIPTSSQPRVPISSPPFAALHTWTCTPKGGTMHRSPSSHCTDYLPFLGRSALPAPPSQIQRFLASFVLFLSSRIWRWFPSVIEA